LLDELSSDVAHVGDRADPRCYVKEDDDDRAPGEDVLLSFGESAENAMTPDRARIECCLVRHTQARFTEHAVRLSSCAGEARRRIRWRESAVLRRLRRLRMTIVMGSNRAARA